MLIPIRRPSESRPETQEMGWDEGELAEREPHPRLGDDPVSVDEAMERGLRRAGKFC